MGFESLDELLSLPGYFQNPYPTYARLRAEAPVHWCEPWGQWLVTRYADVTNMLRQPALFSSSGWEERFLDQLPADAASELPTVLDHYRTKVVSNTDPPEHTRLRKLIAKSFTPKVLALMRPQISRLVDDMVDRMAASTETDLVSSFAYPLPATVIALLLGAPAQDRDRFERWSHDIVSFVGTGSPDLELARREEQSLRQFRAYLNNLIDERRAALREDLLSLLIERSEDGDQLTRDELISTCITLLFAGHETTANLIGNLMLALLRHPDQWGAVVANPGLGASAVEELLRYDSPVQRVRRVATKDLTLSGKTVKRGELVMGFLGSANRDPEVFDNPDSFDLSRASTKHTAFGGGIHFCLGAALSRLEGPIAIQALARRFPKMRLAQGAEPQYRPNMTFRGLASLPVELNA